MRFLLVLMSIALSATLLGAIAYAFHEPTKPFIPLGFPFETQNPLLYKVGIQGNVPEKYRAAAEEAFATWRDKLNDGGGEWKLVKSNFGEDIFIQLIYDPYGTSQFCKNFLSGKTPPGNVGPRAAVFVGCKDRFLDVNDVRTGVSHRIGHGLGLGNAGGGAESVMCTAYSHSIGECIRPEEPSTLDLYCVIKMYKTDGFGKPNAHSFPRFCVLQ